MSTPMDRIDQPTHARILSEKVIPDIGLNQFPSHEHPKAFILGGQPGAGKGGLADAVDSELAGDVVRIDPDDLRDYHPRIHEFRTTNPYTWSGRTQADAGQWADELRDAAVAGRKNFIFDTTLSHGPWSADLIKDLQAKGYDVEVRVVAAPKLESELGVDQRFAKNFDKRGYGRHVPEGARDAIYDKVPASLDTIHAETNARIRIFNREGHELYDSRTDARLPGQVLTEARAARLHDPAVTRDLKRGWQAQRQWHEDLPDAIRHNPKVTPDAAQRLLTGRDAANVLEGVQRDAAQAVSLDYATRVHPSVVKGLGIAGAAAVAYDATTTAAHASDLLHNGNQVGAASQVEHFAGRNVGGLGGAVLGAQVLGAAGVESGPADVIVMGIGALGGAVAGDKLVDAYDRHKIYHQTDLQGRSWQLDPDRPQQGWTRSVVDGFAERGMSVTHLETASPELSGRLTHQANTTAAELAMGRTGKPVDPWTQPANAQDTQSFGDPPWQRNAGTGQWQREIAYPIVERQPVRPSHLETASPQRRTELNAAAERAMADNLATSPRGIAERYQALYAERGWQQYGPVPEAITRALKTPAHTLEASDGHTYTRGKDGEWTTPGRFWGTNTATGNLRAELAVTDMLREAAAKARAPHRVESIAQARPAATATIEAPAAREAGKADTHPDQTHAHAAVTTLPQDRNDLRHPEHPQHALYAKFKQCLPEGTSDARLAQATAACHTAGMKKPEDVENIYSGANGKVLITTNSLFAQMAEMDISRPPPTVQQSMQAMQQYDQQQQQMRLQAQQESMQRAGPAMHR